ncbi:hypothetical protein [Aliarcobacter lanthieri]
MGISRYENHLYKVASSDDILETIKKFKSYTAKEKCRTTSIL